MKLSTFDYSLPADLIAQYPLKERTLAKLLVVDRKNKSILHKDFKDFTTFLNKGELLLLNDTRVLTCRLTGRKATGGKVEVLLIKRKDGSRFEALIQPSRTKIGERITFSPSEVVGVVTSFKEISFKKKDADNIYQLGQVPLPPYIKRAPEELDKDYYQTVYAKKDGAIASPTAGLHFTHQMLKEIESLGIDIAYLTLHVGLGTFKPVRTDDITKHNMEPEYFKVPKITQEKIKAAKASKKRIIAVGTTSLRALEAYAIGLSEGFTNLFIYPGFKFKLADCLLTNFHLPKTTLFMLVSAFAKEDLIKKAYKEAIDNRYRFYSYGDAMFII
ncbi:MAG: tRNA preQ1(34) S-adenosylmethionine ribosyltransferase-isomerase QueA [Candidatus Omnitrophota bacterium]